MQQRSVTVELSVHRQGLSDMKVATKDHTTYPQEKEWTARIAWPLSGSQHRTVAQATTKQVKLKAQYKDKAGSAVASKVNKRVNILLLSTGQRGCAPWRQYRQASEHGYAPWRRYRQASEHGSTCVQNLWQLRRNWGSEQGIVIMRSSASQHVSSYRLTAHNNRRFWSDESL